MNDVVEQFNSKRRIRKESRRVANLGLDDALAELGEYYDDFLIRNLLMNLMLAGFHVWLRPIGGEYKGLLLLDDGLPDYSTYTMCAAPTVVLLLARMGVLANAITKEINR